MSAPVCDPATAPRQCHRVSSAGQPLGQALLSNRGQPLHAAGVLSVDRWNGAERVQLRLADVSTIEPRQR